METSNSVATKLLPLLIAVLIVVLGVNTWVVSKGNNAPLPQGVGQGTLVSVQLVNGQVYYGNVSSSDARQITLQNVYYVQSFVEPGANQPSNRLTNRQRNDWHAPLSMSLSLDKIMMLEIVGPDAKLVQLMKQDQSAAGSQR